MSDVAAAPAAPPTITGAPIIAPDAGAGEPSIEALAALLPDPSAAPSGDHADAADAARLDKGEPAAEPAEGEKPTEQTTDEAAEKPKAETAPTPDTDGALERAEKAAARAREGSRRFREMQAQQEAAQEAARKAAEETQRAAREAEQLRQENAAAKAREEAYKKDPYKALKDAGMTDADLAARAIRENTPEAEIVRLREQFEAERNARLELEKRIEADKVERENQRRQEQFERNKQAAEAAFLAAADNEAEYPELARLKPTAQLDRVNKAIAQIRASGHDPGRLTNEQLAEAAELYIKMERKEEKAKKADAAAKANGAAVTPAARPAPKTSGATLTNAQAQTRTVAPAEWDDLSDDAKIAAIAAGLPDPSAG